jgi:hypothetical protein
MSARPPGEKGKIGETMRRSNYFRVQTRAQVRYRSFYLVDRTGAIGFSPSLELIDASTSITTAVWVTVGFFEIVPPRKP